MVLKLVLSTILVVSVWHCASGAKLPDVLPKILRPKSDQSLAFNTLAIGAFNIQVFGRSKMEKPHVVEHLVNILLRYDLVLIQEIRDITETAIYELLDEVNAASIETYAMRLSVRLGRTSSKEQYAYFYKSSLFTVLDDYQFPEYPEDPYDIFERPPYVVRFRANGYNVDDFAFAGIHAKPDDAVSEIDGLTDVYDEIEAMWGLEDVILGGDFNAGCSYVRPGDWADIRLRQQSRFDWLIPDSADTTIAASQCPYDRFVIHGDNLKWAYQSGTAIAFRFDDYYGLSREEALEVSDHVPVEMHVT